MWRSREVRVLKTCWFLQGEKLASHGDSEISSGCRVCERLVEELLGPLPSHINAPDIKYCKLYLSLTASLVISVQFSSVQLVSRVLLFAAPWTSARQASLAIINSQSPPKLKSIESVMPSNRLILCRPLLLLPSIFPSIRVFSDESALHTRWPKYWSFSFNISPSNEHSGMISFRMDWLDLLAVQGTLKSLLHQSSKASNFLC